MDPTVVAAVLAVTGGIAGVASGFFGIGGGFLMTPVLYRIFLAGGIGDTIATRIAFGTSLAVIIPTMASGASGHHRRGAVDWKAALPISAGAIAGGLVGGTLASRLPGTALRATFAVVVIAMAVRMAWHVRSCSDRPEMRSVPGFVAAGLLVGIVSGLAGIGGGVLLVPLLVILFGFPCIPPSGRHRHASSSRRVRRSSRTSSMGCPYRACHPGHWDTCTSLRGQPSS